MIRTKCPFNCLCALLKIWRVYFSEPGFQMLLAVLFYCFSFSVGTNNVETFFYCANDIYDS